MWGWLYFGKLAMCDGDMGNTLQAELADGPVASPAIQAKLRAAGTVRLRQTPRYQLGIQGDSLGIVIGQSTSLKRLGSLCTPRGLKNIIRMNDSLQPSLDDMAPSHERPTACRPQRCWGDSRAGHHRPTAHK